VYEITSTSHPRNTTNTNTLSRSRNGNGFRNTRCRAANYIEVENKLHSQLLASHSQQTKCSPSKPNTQLTHPVPPLIIDDNNIFRSSNAHTHTPIPIRPSLILPPTATHSRIVNSTTTSSLTNSLDVFSLSFSLSHWQS
jgi:hypothetical protein